MLTESDSTKRFPSFCQWRLIGSSPAMTEQNKENLWSTCKVFCEYPGFWSFGGTENVEEYHRLFKILSEVCWRWRVKATDQWAQWPTYRWLWRWPWRRRRGPSCWWRCRGSCPRHSTPRSWLPENHWRTRSVAPRRKVLYQLEIILSDSELIFCFRALSTFGPGNLVQGITTGGTNDLERLTHHSFDLWYWMDERGAWAEWW